MALTVQTNVSAISALKNLSTNALTMNKSLERLASGFRINSAADDAAGYGISAKLSGERGKLMAASQNALQATAMVKTADAGINEIENMLRRLQVLATQASSANNSGDILKLNNERTTLESQINKIANSTKYNGVSLLNGSAGVTLSGTSTIAPADGVVSVDVSGASGGTTFNVYIEEAAGLAGTFGNGDKVTVSDGTTSQTLTVTTAPTGLGTQSLNFSDMGIQVTIGSAISGLTTDAAGAGDTGTSLGTIVTTAGSSSVFQVGAEANANNQVSADFTNAFTTAGLSLTGDLTTSANAQTYLTTVTASLSTLTTNRAELGATVNQLGYVSANLATSIEQLSAAISTVKDADMAAEMADFTKAQVLVQAGTALLSQANQSPQNVLALFR